MKTKIFLVLCIIIMHISLIAQVKIGNNPTSINSASLLELETTNQGFVLPRVSITDVSSPAPLALSLLTGTVVYNTNSSTTGGSGVGIYLWSGTKWLAISTNISSAAWLLTGNSGTNYSTNFLGTTDNVSLRFRTDNIERLIIDSLGSVGIGSTAFNSVNKEKLLIDYGTTTSHTLAYLTGSIDDYFQINIQNKNSGTSSSADYVATADDGTDSTYYADFGINNSTYAPSVENWGGPHDAYLYSSSRNLLIGAQAASSDVIFLLGGGRTKYNTVLRLDGTTGNVIVGTGNNQSNATGNTIRGPNGNGTNIPGGSLTLQGGAATGTATGGSLNLYGGSTVSGTYGALNINTDTNSATNINTGTSTGTVTLGNALNNINLPKLSASSVVLTDAGKNLTSTIPSNNTYLYYNGTNFTWATASSSLASLTNGSGIASLNYNGSAAATVSLANGTAAGQVYVTGATPFTPALVTMSGDATISSAGALTLATVNSNIGTFNNLTVNAKGLVTAASNVAYTTLGSFSATSPLSYNNATGVFSISQANTLTNGYLSSTDWNTFNNKAGSITLNTPSSVFSNPINFSVSSGAATGSLSLNTQTANTVFAGPASGVAAVPTFRALAAADIPSLAGSYIQNQTIQQASSNFNISGNGTIGTNLSVTGTSTLTGLLTSNGGHTNSGVFTTSGGAVNINASSNNATNINTGTSTGTVTLGNALNNISLPKLSASSVVLTDAGKNLTSTTPSNNTYLYYNGANFTWATAASSLASLTNGSGIASLNYNGSSAGTVSLANGTAAGQVYVTGATPFTPALVTMNGDATLSSAGALSLAAVNSNIGTFNNLTVNAKGLVTAASNVAYTTLGSFSATSPLSYNNATGVFSISQANTLTNGYLSSIDWNTFNNKVGSITLNTPGAVFSNPINFSVSSGAATGSLSLNTQTANTVFAGPASGVAAVPTFRALAAADIPSLAGSYIQNQTIQQASSNFNISGNGTIGTNLAVTGTSTLTGLLTSNGGHTNSGVFTTSGGAVNINASSNNATNINTGTSTGTVTLGNALNNISLPKLSATSVVLTDAGKNLSSSIPSNNTYLYYNGANFTWATAASSLASLTNGSGIAALNYNGSSAGTVSLANGTAAGQVYVTGATPFTPALVTMSGDATISSAGALTLATVNSNIGTFNNLTVNAKGLVTAASNVAYTTLGSFSATSPLSYNNATGVFSISQANTLTNGYLSSTDWNTFNNKAGSITLNTPSSVFSNPINFSVSSGAATGSLSFNTQTANTVFAGPASGVAAAPTFRALVAADIPSLAGLYIQNQSTLQASSNFNVSGNGTIGTNLSVTGTSTLTGLLTSNGGHTNAGAFTTSGGITNINASSNFATNINIGTSTSNVTIGNSSNNILFPKFNTAGGMIYTTAATGQIAGTGSNITWDDVNNRLGIGITSPSYKLSVLSAANPLYLSGVQATAAFTTDSLLTIYNGVVKKAPTSSLGNVAWSLTGNSGTTAGTNFIGTTDAVDFVTKTNNTERMRILGAVSGSSQAGWIGMGISVPRSSLDVTGYFANKNVLTLENTSATGYSSVDMMDSTGALKGTFGYANAGTGSLFGGRDYFNIYGNDFVFTAGLGTYNFFIKGSTGYIGLNTNTPSERLHLVGNFYLNGAFMPGGDAGTSGYVLTSAGAGTSPTWTNATDFAWGTTGNSGTSASTNFIGTTDAVDFVAKTNNTERMRVTSAGDIVIGAGDNSNSPADGLVRGASATGGNRTGADLTIEAGNGTGNGGSGNIIFKTAHAGSAVGSAADIMSEKMRIDDAGNLGIGTTNPAYKLHVLASSNPLYLGGVQATAAFTTDSLLTIYNGVVKKAPYSALPGGSSVAANTVFGNFSNASATPAFNAASADGQFLVRRSGALTFGTLQASDLPAGNDNYIQDQSASVQTANYYISGPASIGTANVATTQLSVATSTAANTGIIASNTAAAGTSFGNGIKGQTSQTNGFGVWGINANPSLTGAGTAVVGAAQNIPSNYLATGSGGAFTGYTTGVFAYNTSAGASQAIYSNNNGTICRVNYYNGTTQYKILGTGTVSTTASALDNQNRVILHALEAPEIYFEDYGEGKLVNGKVHINLDPLISKNVAINDKHPLRVFIQLEGDCNGVYVTNKSKTGFDVAELSQGKSNVSFQWHIVCNRADEKLPNGKISYNEDVRFEQAPADVNIQSIRIATPHPVEKP